MQSGATALARHFEDINQQRSASILGMWVFLATEVMFFGGLFLAFAVARFLYPENFNQAARHLDIVAGSINTGILFTSSFTTALAVSTLKRDWKLSTIGLLLLSVSAASALLGWLLVSDTSSDAEQSVFALGVLLLLGGAAGCLLGRGVSLAITGLLGWPTAFSWPAILASLAVSIGVWLAFGYFPAWKASRLDPIDALRYE